MRRRRAMLMLSTLHCAGTFSSPIFCFVAVVAVGLVVVP